MSEQLFQKTSFENATILLNEKSLIQEYTPTLFIMREKELKEIADAIKPLVMSMQGENLFIHGPCGSGKLTLMRYILDKLSRETKRVIPVYVNCWEHSTQMGIYSKVIEHLGMPLPRRGLAADEVSARIIEEMDREGLSVLLVLDKMHSLVFRGEEDIFHAIARANEQRTRFGIIGISDDRSVLEQLSDSVRSMLYFTTLEFTEYGIEDIMEILSRKASIALAKGSYSDEVMLACAKIGKAANGNARLALEMLWRAARNAQKNGKSKISLSDVEAVSSRTDYARAIVEDGFEGFNMKDYGLSSEEKLALQIVAKKKEIESRELYQEFVAIRQVSKRQIRNYLSLLDAKGLIKMRSAEGSGLLRGKIIRLACKM